MTTRSDMEAELVSQLQVASNSSLFPASRITSLIQNSYKWATNLFIWNDLVKALVTDSGANQEYYDYPDEFRSNSIMRLTVDDVSYERKNFEDYLAYKEDHSTNTLKMFANYGRFYFINPTPTAVGSNNIDIWGAYQADALSSAGSTTIFSDNNPEGNEAVVQRAFGVAMKRINEKLSNSEIQQAIIVLSKLHKDEVKATQRDQRLNHPKFDVPNYFPQSGRGPTPIGRFNYQP